MIQTAVAAFIGALTALIMMKETEALSGRVIRYLSSLVVGIIVTIILSLFASWVAGLFAKVA